MKDVIAVFDENLKIIADIVAPNNYRNCLLASANLTQFCNMSEYDDGVLISEILESVFSQVGPLFDDYLISDKEKEGISNDIKSSLKVIINNYGKSDKNDLYTALKNFRFTATKIQMKLWTMGIRKPQKAD